MDTATWSWLIAPPALVALEALTSHIALSVVLRRRSDHEVDPEASLPDSAPSLSVIIPARDEQDNIERCMRTLVDQDYPDLEIIVVDDRSEDRTPQILRRLQDEHPKTFTVLVIEHLPDGWVGKCHAAHEGVAHSGGEWLCLIDADTCFASQRAISVAVAHALETGADCLSMLPRLQMPKVWERIVYSACGSTMLTWFPPGRVNNPHSRCAYANGAFILMRRPAYEAIGGHEAVRDDLNEDVRIAQYVKDAGLRLRVADSGGLLKMWMYDRPRQAWQGWSRIVCRSVRSIWTLIGTAVWKTLVDIVPIVCVLAGLGVAIFGPSEGRRLAWVFVGLWAAAEVAEMTVCMRLYRLLSLHSAWALTRPLGTAATVAIILHAICQRLGLRKTVWRGRHYRSKQGPPPDASGQRAGAVSPFQRR